MLTEILMTRCCHDLAGATGALGNTIQLMEMDASFAAEGLDFLKKATQTLTARLQFFRALAGLNGKVTPDVAPAYLQTLSMPIRLDGVPQTQIELAFVFLGSEILIKGGSITVQAGQVTVSGARLLFPDDKRQLLLATTEPVDSDYIPANAAVLWLRHLIKGQPIGALLSDNEITFTW